MSDTTPSQPMHLLKPEVLASLSNLELVARSVVDGGMIGMHRSPNFGFSQEFEEYRQYADGDDIRFIDWNVYARSERTYIKRFRGETNAPLTILIDASASMGFQSEQATVTKLAYAKYLAASLAYLANKQRDAIGLLSFDESVREFRRPSSKTGQLQGILHQLDQTRAADATSLQQPLQQIVASSGKRGMVALISDFYCEHDALLEAVKPLVIQGQDMILFQILDPGEIKPDFDKAKLVKDPESGSTIEVSAKFMKKTYPARMQAHIDQLKDTAGKSRADHVLMNTKDPLNHGLHQYLTFRQRRK